MLKSTSKETTVKVLSHSAISEHYTCDYIDDTLYLIDNAFSFDVLIGKSIQVINGIFNGSSVRFSNQKVVSYKDRRVDREKGTWTTFADEYELPILMYKSNPFCIKGECSRSYERNYDRGARLVVAPETSNFKKLPWPSDEALTDGMVVVRRLIITALVEYIAETLDPIDNQKFSSLKPEFAYAMNRMSLVSSLKDAVNTRDKAYKEIETARETITKRTDEIIALQKGLK